MRGGKSGAEDWRGVEASIKPLPPPQDAPPSASGSQIVALIMMTFWRVGPHAHKGPLPLRSQSGFSIPDSASFTASSSASFILQTLLSSCSGSERTERPGSAAGRSRPTRGQTPAGALFY